MIKKLYLTSWLHQRYKYKSLHNNYIAIIFISVYFLACAKILKEKECLLAIASHQWVIDKKTEMGIKLYMSSGDTERGEYSYQRFEESEDHWPIFRKILKGS